MKNDGNFEDEKADGLDARSDAPLWDLLGRADRPEAGPYFSRRVLREVSLLVEAPAPWWQPAAFWRACRRLPRLAFVTGTPVAALFLLFVGLHEKPAGSRTPVTTPAVVAKPAAPPAKETAPAPVTEDEEIAASLAEEGTSLAPAIEEDNSAASLAENAPAAVAAPGMAAPALPEGLSEQDVEVIAELDTLREREQNRLWTEDTARF